MIDKSVQDYYKKNMLPIKGDGITLRSVEPDDICILKKWWAEPEGNYYDCGRKDMMPPDPVLKAISAQINAGCLRSWFMIENSDKIPIGYILYRNLNISDSSCEIAIRLGRDYWGKGYGTAATKCIMKWIFGQFGIDLIWLSTLEINARAIRMYEKCRFEITDRVVDDDGTAWHIMCARNPDKYGRMVF